MNEKVTADSIIGWLEEQVAQKLPVAPTKWLEASQKLTVLKEDEDDRLYDLQQEVAQMKVGFISQGDSVAMAKAKVEATDAYKAMCKQKAKLVRITEMVQIAKIQARTRENTWNNQQ